MNKKQKQLLNLILSSIFLALGIVLPFITGNIPFLGNRFLPMHIPVLVCGFVCGWKYGGLVGVLTPLLRALLVGIPLLYPVAFIMSFELATYGLITGLFYQILPKKTINVIGSLISAMILGRIVWGIVGAIVYSSLGVEFTMTVFIMAAFITALPGIIFQLIFIPILIIFMQKNEVLSRYLQ